MGRIAILLMARKRKNRKQNLKKNPISKKNICFKKVLSSFFYIILIIVIIIVVLSFNKGTFWPDITISVLSIILSSYLTILQNIPKKTKGIVIIVTISLCIHTGYKIIKSHEKSKLKTKTIEYYNQSQEREELHTKGLSDEDIWKYNKNPLLKRTLSEAAQDRADGKFDIAINKYKSCLKHPNATLEDQHWINSHIAGCYKDLKDLSASAYHWKLALQKANEIDDNEMVKTWYIGRSYDGLGTLYFLFKQYDKALEFYKKSLMVYKDGGGIQGTAGGYYNVALTWHAVNEYNNALKNYYSCIDFSKKHHQIQFIPKSLCNIAIILWDTEQENYEKIIKRCEKVITEAISISDRECVARAANFAAHLSFEYKQFNRSIKFNEQYIEYSESKNTNQVGVALAMIGEMYFRKREFESSIEYYEKAKDVFSKVGNIEFVIEALERKGLAYDFIKRPHEALEYWNKALSLSKKYGFREREKLLLRNIEQLKAKIE